VLLGGHHQQAYREALALGELAATILLAALEQAVKEMLVV
jgi:hypothetical protein